MTHDEYIDAIRELQTMMDSAIGEIDTLELTDEERTIIDNLPDDKKRLIDTLLSRYQAGPVDVRRNMIEKGIAVMLLKGGAVIRRAWELGNKAGESFG